MSDKVRAMPWSSSGRCCGGPRGAWRRASTRWLTPRAGSLRHASERAGELPLTGDRLRQPFDDTAGRVDQIVRSATEQVQAIDSTASLVGWLVLLIPVLTLRAWWVPTRLCFWQRRHAAQRLLGSSADLGLFALCAPAARR